MYNLTSSFSWATEMAIPFFHSSLVCIKAQYGSSLYGNSSESSGMDGFFFPQELCFSSSPWLSWFQILPVQTCAEQSKQVSIKERGSLAIYCYFGPSATLIVMAFVCVQASVFNDCENVRLVLECLDLSILYTCCRVHLCVHTSSWLCKR